MRIYDDVTGNNDPTDVDASSDMGGLETHFSVTPTPFDPDLTCITIERIKKMKPTEQNQSQTTAGSTYFLNLLYKSNIETRPWLDTP